MYPVGLVLEGGAMKGVYTAGVLDFFLDEGIDFENATAFPRGHAACAAICQSSGQGVATMTDYLKDKRYWGLSSLLRTGDLLTCRCVTGRFPKRSIRFDYEAFDKNSESGLCGCYKYRNGAGGIYTASGNAP